MKVYKDFVHKWFWLVCVLNAISLFSVLMLLANLLANLNANILNLGIIQITTVIKMSFAHLDSVILLLDFSAFYFAVSIFYNLNAVRKERLVLSIVAFLADLLAIREVNNLFAEPNVGYVFGMLAIAFVLFFAVAFITKLDKSNKFIVFLNEKLADKDTNETTTSTEELKPKANKTTKELKDTQDYRIKAKKYY